MSSALQVASRCPSLSRPLPRWQHRPPSRSAGGWRRPVTMEPHVPNWQRLGGCGVRISTSCSPPSSGVLARPQKLSARRLQFGPTIAKPIGLASAPPVTGELQASPALRQLHLSSGFLECYFVRSPESSPAPRRIIPSVRGSRRGPVRIPARCLSPRTALVQCTQSGPPECCSSGRHTGAFSSRPNHSRRQGLHANRRG